MSPLFNINNYSSAALAFTIISSPTEVIANNYHFIIDEKYACLLVDKMIIKTWVV